MYLNFFIWQFSFFVVKFSLYLNRHVFVMKHISPIEKRNNAKKRVFGTYLNCITKDMFYVLVLKQKKLFFEKCVFFWAFSEVWLVSTLFSHKHISAIKKRNKASKNCGYSFELPDQRYLLVLKLNKLPFKKSIYLGLCWSATFLY